MYYVQGAYDARGKPTGFHTSRNSKFELTKILGYTIENPNRRSWGHTFLKKPREWLGLSLYTWKFWRKQSFTPRYFRKLCYTPQKFQSNKFNIIFFNHTWKFHFFLNWPLDFPHAFSSILLETPFRQPSCLDFFLEQPIWTSLATR